MFELGKRRFDAWGRYRLRSFKTALRDQPFGLSRVCLVLDRGVEPSDDSVECAALFGVVRAGAEAGPDGDLVVFRDRLLKPVKGKFAAFCGEVVSMD